MPRARQHPAKSVLATPHPPLAGAGAVAEVMAELGSAATRRPWPWPTLLRGSVGLHAAAAGATLLWPGMWPWALGALALNHGVLSTAGLWPRSRCLGPNVTHLPDAAVARRQVAITLDDGPDPEVTPAVLDLLAAQTAWGPPAQAGAPGQQNPPGVKVTFFCIAEKARAHPALVRRMVAAGHSVQNHSLAHHHHFALLGPKGLAREVQQAQAVLADITGVLPHCFRAPAGLRNPLLDPVLHHAGLHLVSWSRRGYDTRRRQRSAAGQPVLLDVLPHLLAHCRRLGLQTVTLGEALPLRHQAT